MVWAISSAVDSSCPAGEVLVADVHLALNVQRPGLVGGVVLLHQVQGLGDNIGIPVDPYGGAVHRQGVNVVQLGMLSRMEPVTPDRLSIWSLGPGPWSR